MPIDLSSKNLKEHIIKNIRHIRNKKTCKLLTQTEIYYIILLYEKGGILCCF